MHVDITEYSISGFRAVALPDVGCLSIVTENRFLQCWNKISPKNPIGCFGKQPIGFLRKIYAFGKNSPDINL